MATRSSLGNDDDNRNVLISDSGNLYLNLFEVVLSLHQVENNF